MVKFRAIETGYYGDIIHVPEGKHEVFDAPEDWKASWAVRDDGTVAEAPEEVSEDTLAAEAMLATESEAARSDDVPANTEEDINAATGVETL